MSRLSKVIQRKPWVHRASSKDTGQAVRDRLIDAWGRGRELEAILLGGGGAELPQITDAIRESFPHAVVVDEPQTAIARGYARLARRQALTAK